MENKNERSEVLQSPQFAGQGAREALEPSADLVARMRRVASLFLSPVRAPFVRAYGVDDYENWSRLLLDGAKALESADREVGQILAILAAEREMWTQSASPPATEAATLRGSLEEQISNCQECGCEQCRNAVGGLRVRLSAATSEGRRL